MKNKKFLSVSFFFLCTSVVLTVLSFSIVEKKQQDSHSTSTNSLEENRAVSQTTKDYWYDGTAEISSFKLSQAQYGEKHQGTATLVFVTEPFSKKSNTKADNNRSDNISVLKLNKTLKFNTGIYPYSMMNTTFFPFEKESTSLKIASSVQEWCGMTYLEMANNDKGFLFNFNSYFEGQSYQDKRISKATLEDDLWSLIRLNPELLPLGEQNIIPSMLSLRLKHKQPKAYKTIAALKKDEEGISHYSLKYPDLERELTIKFETEFPHRIIGWEDKSPSGYGVGKKMMSSKAELIKTLKTDYWNKNGVGDAGWREELGL
ncbi:MAG: septum formation inhibitor Maf [Saprospiraceae bacterium]